MSNAPIAYFNEDGVAVFRASAVGNCEAALVYSLRGMEPAEPPDDMKRRFADGHLHEPAIIDHLRNLGWAVTDSQKEFVGEVAEGIVIVCHVDGIGEKDGLRAVIEAKALSDAGYKKWVADGFKAFPKYGIQVAVQMKLTGLPVVFAVKNKNSGEIDVQHIEAPPYLFAKLKAKMMRVVREAAGTRVPACPKVFDYPCPYYALHEDRKGKQPVEDPTDLQEEFNELAAKYLEYKGNEARFKELAEEQRQAILEQMGQSSTAASSLFTIEKTVVKSKRLDTKRLRAAFPDLGQFETESESVRLNVKPRTES